LSLDGELTVRMVTKRVTLSIDSVETTGMGFLATATATARIDRYAFGITAAKGMAAPVPHRGPGRRRQAALTESQDDGVRQRPATGEVLPLAAEPPVSRAFHRCCWRDNRPPVDWRATMRWQGQLQEGRSCRSDQEPLLTIRSVVGTQPVTNG
jgi:hypothetical protein